MPRDPVSSPSERWPIPIPGETFAGRYEIRRLLGRGGSGAVYEAFDQVVGDAVALKALTVPLDGNDVALERFKSEVRLARRITHPNIARIHDLAQHAGLWFLTMELVRGHDLWTVLEREGRMTPQRAATILRSVADGLAAAHAAGIIHRDLKPGNVLVESGGRIVLTDFGVARSVAEQRPRSSGTIGTPQYMAPEQVRGKEADARADIYSLGVMFYELLVGLPPFTAPSPLASALARLEEPVPDPRKERRDVPDDVAELVMSCLAKEPGGRPATAADLSKLLEKWAELDGAVVLPGIGPGRVSASPSEPRTDRAPDTISPPGRTLAVVPFRYRGPGEYTWLGETLSDELVDVLSRTRGLRVLGTGATQRVGSERDPREIGRALGVDVVVDGTIQAFGDVLRVSAKLSEAQNGMQLWADRFEGPLGDILQLQDTISHRIAEALRVSIDTANYSVYAPADAMECYLRARRILRNHDATHALADAAIQLEECLRVAPGFVPAMSAHARACLWAWFVPGLAGRDWGHAARKSVARALDRAAEVAETQLVAGVLAVQDGNYADAAHRLRRALEIAPTYPEAHEYLGRLQSEAGRAEEGVRRVRLALELDPTLAFAEWDLARIHALHGDWSAARFRLERLASKLPEDHPAVVSARLRFACWSGDRSDVARCVELLERTPGTTAALLLVYGRQLLAASPVADLPRQLSRFDMRLSNPRFRSFALQIATEVTASASAVETAIEYLRRAAESVLVDVEWLDRCPALESLRSTRELVVLRRAVATRAAAIWAA